jgi:hypothetical protein
MNKTEVVDGLKSARKESVEELQALQAQGAQAIKSLDEARESKDEGKVSEASEGFERVGEAIKSAQAKIEGIDEQIGWFREYQVEEDGTDVTDKRLQEMKSLFEELKGQVNTGAPASKKTVGEYFADALKYRGITRAQDIADLRADTQLTALLGPTPDAKEIMGQYKSIKSIYTNHGVELLDASEDPVPGFMGFQCGLVEDTNITCLLEPPKDDFEACITQATLAGNRIRFTREVSREDAAASVLETVYNPYPTLERNGTKPEGIFTLASVEVVDSKIAEFVTASDEVLEDCPSTAGLIDNFLISGINKEKRRQLIAGSGVNGQMRGILSQPDVLTRTHQDVGDGGTADDNFYDTFRRGLTDLYLQAASTDNLCVIMNPRDVEKIDLAKDELGHYLFNDGADCLQRVLRCINIRVSVDMPAGTAVLGDFSNNWVFYTRKALNIRMGYTGDQFITNTNTILGEMRGLALLRCPRKVLKVTGLA